ncbi:MAG: NAD-dependent epimerase/dehydratase family protein, partial [Acidimicrobiales bacterium]
SAEGYGPNKVAAEQVLLDSGHPVTVLRPSKVHGAWSRRPREWVFVKRVLDRREVVLLARGGKGADHPSAAQNVAALIDVVAAHPGRRILNIADPDCPDGRTIASVVADHLGHAWEEVLLGPADAPGLGAHPWDSLPPVVLDCGAARRLGYEPVGDYATTVTDELDWLVACAHDERGRHLLPSVDDPFFAPMCDYGREDDFLARR